MARAVEVYNQLVRGQYSPHRCAPGEVAYPGICCEPHLDLGLQRRTETSHVQRLQDFKSREKNITASTPEEGFEVAKDHR